MFCWLHQQKPHCLSNFSLPYRTLRWRPYALFTTPAPLKWCSVSARGSGKRRASEVGSPSLICPLASSTTPAMGSPGREGPSWRHTRVPMIRHCSRQWGMTTLWKQCWTTWWRSMVRVYAVCALEAWSKSGVWTPSALEPLRFTLLTSRRTMPQFCSTARKGFILQGSIQPLHMPGLKLQWNLPSELQGTLTNRQFKITTKSIYCI